MLTESFFLINFLFSILISTVALVFSLTMIIIVATHQTCRSVSNLVTCNTSVFIAIYFIINFASSIYGFRADWAFNQPVCLFRAYSFIAVSGSICYSYLVQAISRFFFVVLFKHKYLVTYRVHWYMIALNWIIGILYSTVPLFFEGGYVFEKESHLCTLTTKKFSTCMYAIFTGFIIPLSISFVIYGKILYRAHHSSRRIAALSSITTSYIASRRDIMVVRKMVTLGGIFAGVGTPYLILVLWHGIQRNASPPESFYLLCINGVSVFFALMIVALFHMNKQVRDVLPRYLQGTRRLRHQTIAVQPRTLLTVGFEP
jgi:hypothetical protein